MPPAASHLALPSPHCPVLVELDRAQAFAGEPVLEAPVSEALGINCTTEPPCADGLTRTIDDAKDTHVGGHMAMCGGESATLGETATLCCCCANTVMGIGVVVLLVVANVAPVATTHCAGHHGMSFVSAPSLSMDPMVSWRVWQGCVCFGQHTLSVDSREVTKRVTERARLTNYWILYATHLFDGGVK